MQFFDKRDKITTPLATLPKGADSSNFVAVPDSAPTCCREAIYNWAVHYEVPGNLQMLISGKPYACANH